MKTISQRLDAIERKMAANQKKKLTKRQRKDEKLQESIRFVLSELEKNALRTTYE